MLKQIKNLNKQTKIAVIVVLIFILAIGGTGAILYAQDQQNQQVILQQVQELNSAIRLPNNVEYNESELAEYNELVNKREQAFNNNDVETLRSLQRLFEELDNKVNDRLEKESEERKAKEEAEKKVEAEQQQSSYNDNDYNGWSGNSNDNSSHGGNGSHRSSNENRDGSSSSDIGRDDFPNWGGDTGWGNNWEWD